MVFWFSCITVFLREICVDSSSTKFCRRALVYIVLQLFLIIKRRIYIRSSFMPTATAWLKQNYTIMQGSLCRYSPIIKELPFLIILGYTVIYTIIKKKNPYHRWKKQQRPYLRWLYGRGHFGTISFSFRNM